MRTISSCLISWILILISIVPAVARTVVSATTGEPVVYASVGVLNKTLGTVTDSTGTFRLTVPREMFDDTLRISCVGYETRDFRLRGLMAYGDTIRLAEVTVALNEVVVKPRNIKHKTAGRKGKGGFVYIEIESDRAAGQGVAIPLEVKNVAWLKELGFCVIDNDATVDHMKFRVNVYRKTDGEYLIENMLPVYFDFYKDNLKDEWFTYVFPEEMMLEKGEYYIELEFLENFRGKQFIMKSKPLTGRTRYRYASQSQWETLPFGAPIYIDYDATE